MTVFTTPTGRLVGGDPFTLQPKTDPATKAPVMDKQTGLQVKEVIVQVAFAKTDPLFWPWWQVMKAQDRADWPSFHGADGNVLPGVLFADKLKDGDGVDRKGQLNSRKDGWAGCWVVTFGSRFLPSVMVYDDAGRTWRQTTDPTAIKLGDYIQVNGSTSSNNSTQSPGMYRNVNMVALYGRGEPIQRGADPNEAFAAPPPGSAAPAMVTAPAPMAPAAPVAPAAPAAPMAPVAPVAPAAPVQPYDGYRQAPPAAPAAPAAPMPPAAPPAPPAPPAAPLRQMTAAANGTPYEAWLANGWTDETLRANGYMV